VAEQLHSLAEQTDCVVNRMKEIGILMGADGPDHSVIKIKPPLTFTKERSAFLFAKNLWLRFYKNNLTSYENAAFAT
jgi:4-aminobutyrate aminotransferase-like enzyme